MRKETLWEAQLRADPAKSQWYIQRFEAMRAEGADLDGEARLVDAMLPRRARILDAGCGPGRVGGELSRRGHRVIGVDVDPALIDAARRDHPGADWRVGDLAELELEDRFDLIVCAGNVLTFLAPGTAPEVLRRFGTHLAEGGRVVVGFGTGRGYPVPGFLRDAEAAGLAVDSMLATWDLRPYDDAADFLVAVLSRG